MQCFDNLQIGHQRSQLGGGTQVQLCALVDIQGLIETIGLNPKLGAARGQLGKREAIDDLVQVIFLIEQPVRVKPYGFCIFRFPEPPQHYRWFFSAVLHPECSPPPGPDDPGHTCAASRAGTQDARGQH